MRLLDYSHNYYSQYGEDGILAKILTLLPSIDRWSVEFGAWDGEHFSNTCHLIEKEGFSSVMIEGDPVRFQDLMKRHGENPKVIKLEKMVGFSPKDNLDHLLSKTSIPKDFDVLSIDINGNDYHVWRAMEAYTPKIVIIEHNSTIPTEVDFVQEPDPSLSQGSGLRPLVSLGKAKGYELVAVTSSNAIFVKDLYFPLFNIPNNDPSFLREDNSGVTYLFSGFDGTLFLRGNKSNPWNKIKYRWMVHQLPRIFREPFITYGPLRRVFFKLYRNWLRLGSRIRGGF